ncbi:MAG: pyridoxamine 5'-phosphate oxidase family protein [Bacilli bacterium]|nr:pyridoxamine 5'-phosphate oxidase family protein [Bacilli bacterium]
MNSIVKELKDTGVFYIATIDNNHPRVRPFSSVCEYNEKVYFCTNNTKKVWEQIIQNPNVEISGMKKNGQWIRVTGTLITDDSLEAKKAVLEDETGPKNLYNYEDEIFKVMYLENPECILYSFDKDPVKIKES